MRLRKLSWGCDNIRCHYAYQYRYFVGVITTGTQ